MKDGLEYSVSVIDTPSSTCDLPVVRKEEEGVQEFRSSGVAE